MHQQSEIRREVRVYRPLVGEGREWHEANAHRDSKDQVESNKAGQEIHGSHQNEVRVDA